MEAEFQELVGKDLQQAVGQFFPLTDDPCQAGVFI